MGALIVDEGRVVVVRHRKGDSVYHLLPGGGVDFGETLEAALIREVREETGLAVELGPLVCLTDTIDPAGTRHVVNVTLFAQPAGAAVAPKADDRVEGVEFVSLDELNRLDLRPPIADIILDAVRSADSWKPIYAGSLFTQGHESPHR